MSSSDTPTSSLIKLGKNVASWTGWVASKSILGPVATSATGVMATGKFLLYTTVGRIAIVGVLAFATLTVAKTYFTNVERKEWEEAVGTKQADILQRVDAVETATEQNSRMASVRISSWDSIVALVTGGIWRTEPQDPVEADTVDLINETRGDKP